MYSWLMNFKIVLRITHSEWITNERIFKGYLLTAASILKRPHYSISMKLTPQHKHKQSKIKMRHIKSKIASHFVMLFNKLLSF